MQSTKYRSIRSGSWYPATSHDAVRAPCGRALRIAIPCAFDDAETRPGRLPNAVRAAYYDLIHSHRSSKCVCVADVSDDVVGVGLIVQRLSRTRSHTLSLRRARRRETVTAQCQQDRHRSTGGDARLLDKPDRDMLVGGIRYQVT